MAVKVVILTNGGNGKNRDKTGNGEYRGQNRGKVENMRQNGDNGENRGQKKMNVENSG